MSLLLESLAESVPALIAAYPIPFALGVVVLLLAVLYFRNKEPKRSPPVVAGWIPWVGVGLKFAGGPLQYATQLYKEKGEIFTLKMFGKRMTFLVGHNAHVPFFAKGDKELGQEEPYRFSVPIFGKGVVYDADLIHRTQQLKFISKSLSSETLHTYVPMIVKEAEDYFGKLPDSGQFDIKDALSELIILTASRCLMGQEIRENLFKEVAGLYQILDEGLLPISVFFPYLPIPAHRRRDKARLAMVELFSKIIHQRRQHPEVVHNDVLQVFMDASYRDGTTLTEDHITGMLIALLFAGQHTSSVTGSWTGLLLLKNKEKFLGPVLEEQKRVLADHGGELNFDALAEMNNLHWCLKEALRMYPPLIFVMRTVKESFDFEGYEIPKGDTLFVSPALSMRVDSAFTKPDDYDPLRFSPERGEDTKVKYAYLGFGAGRHACMGEQFAYVQIKTIWSVLLRNFEMELVGELPKPDYTAMVVGPKHPALIRYKRISKK